MKESMHAKACDRLKFVSLGPGRSRIWATVFLTIKSVLSDIVTVLSDSMTGSRNKNLAYESSDIAIGFNISLAEKNNAVYVFLISI